MLKGLFIGIISLMSVNSVQTNADSTLSENMVCRVTCTVSVPDGFGGSIGFSGTAGNFLTSCENARDKACRRAFQNAMDAFMDM